MNKKIDKTQFKLFLRFLKLLLPYRKIWFLVLTLSSLGALLSLVNPYLTKLVIDKGFGNKDLRIFLILALIGGGIFVLNGLFGGLRQLLDRYIKIKVNFDLNKIIFKHLHHLSFAYFTDKSSAEHLYKVNYDIERATEFITTIPPQSVSIFPRLLFILGIVFYLNWRMAVISLILAPFLYLPNYYFVKRVRSAWKILIENYEAMFKKLSENFSHIQVIKSFGKETQSTINYLRMLIINIRIKMQNIKLEISSSLTSQLFNKAIVGLLAFYGGYQVIKGQMTLGSLAAVMVYLTQLVGLQSQFAYFFQTTALGLVSCRRLAEVLDEKTMVLESREAKKLKFNKGMIIFEDLSFGYRPNEPILKRINFTIEGASSVALVGPSGCGKTTILNLILRLYDPWSGDIKIDGYNIRDLKFSSLREQIGIALQESLLWNDTIKNNIKYGRPEASDEEIIEVAKICGVDQFVSELPNRYETVIGENACKISEGQKQKIAIARAIIKRPKILILDEAMSSMDSASEERILANIKERQKELTLIVVSHRLSTIMNTGLVYYLESSDRIVVDTAKNLLENNQNFANLFVGQSAICV